MQDRTDDPPAEPLARELTRFALFALAINGMVGAGIFGLPAAPRRAPGASARSCSRWPASSSRR